MYMRVKITHKVDKNHFKIDLQPPTLVLQKKLYFMAHPLICMIYRNSEMKKTKVYCVLNSLKKVTGAGS